MESLREVTLCAVAVQLGSTEGSSRAMPVCADCRKQPLSIINDSCAQH